MRQAEGYSYGKVILSGEHSVVYGHPALVAGVQKKMHVVVGESQKTELHSPLVKEILSIFTKRFDRKVDTVSVSIYSEIPEQSGLGSSAALAHALFLALANFSQLSIEQAEMLDLVQQSEAVAHGRASGVDTAAIVQGGVIRFQRTDSEPLIEHIDPQYLSSLDFSLIYSGKPEETTKEMVELVAKRIEQDPRSAKRVAEIGDVTAAIIESVQRQNFNFGLLDHNQRLLSELGVVGAHASSMIKQIQERGGVAKVTGAGGVKKGSGMILAYHPDSTVLEDMILDLSWNGFKINIAG